MSGDGRSLAVTSPIDGRVTEATAVLGQLPPWVQRVSFGQTVSVGGRGEAHVEALSSGLALGACNWRMSLWNRSVSLMGESSLWQNRHCLPCDAAALLRCDLLVVAVARAAAGGDASARVGQELRALLATGMPVVVPLASLAGPVLFDVLDVVARELGQQPPLWWRGPRCWASTLTLLIWRECTEASRRCVWCRQSSRHCRSRCRAAPMPSI